MSPCAIKDKNKNFVLDFVYQKPVRFDVAFTRSFVVAGKFMVPVFCIKCAAFGKNVHDFEEFVQIPVLFFRQFQIFLELVREFDFVFHASKAALNSSMLE